MNIHDLALFALLVVAALTLVQSIFGVGLLVFGTPTLLLAGFEFDRALALLLPASMCVSAAQLYVPELKRAARWRYLGWSVPFMIAGLVCVLGFDWQPNMRKVVGLMLLATAMIRLQPVLHARTRDLLVRHQRFYLAAMGAVHGVSNMGGGLLTILANSLHEEKRTARVNIALVYFVFAVSQLAVLAALRPAVFDCWTLASGLVALAVYALIGNRIFELASNRLYQTLISVLLLVYGSVLML